MLRLLQLCTDFPHKIFQSLYLINRQSAPDSLIHAFGNGLKFLPASVPFICQINQTGTAIERIGATQDITETF